jgi:hypothetical protein
MPTVFFSYSHEDEELRNRLEKHLALLKRQNLIEAWHDRRILAGSELDNSIAANLEAADIILLLVSADFLASEYCYSKEMQRAMERHQAGSAVVIPVILKPCDWHSAPFGKVMATPRDGKAVTTWANVEEALADVSLHIRRRVEDMHGKHKSSAAAIPLAGASTPPFTVPPNNSIGIAPRSSNLRVKKEFSEHDRDDFLHSSFEFFAGYFENSLNELAQRNHGTRANFRRVDSNSFTAVIYLDGERKSECMIRLGGMGGKGITYSSDSSVHNNSVNEWLTVEADDHGIFFRPTMFSFGSERQHSRMTPEAGAEHFWTTLMKPLQ